MLYCYLLYCFLFLFSVVVEDLKLKMANKNIKAKQKKNEDPTWDHCSRVGDNRMHLKCNYCGLDKWGGVSRMKHHFAGTHLDVTPCTQCPPDVIEKFSQMLEGAKGKNEDPNECFIEDVERGT